MIQDKDRAIQELAQRAYEESYKLQVHTDYNVLIETQSILLIRSCPINQFEKFLEKAASINPQMHLTVIGKASDEEMLQRFYNGRYRLIPVDGSYTVESLKEYIPALKEETFDAVVFYSRVVPSGDYDNIYSLTDNLKLSSKFYIFDGYKEVTEIVDFTRWNTAVKLLLALADWYWRDIWQT